ncbi:hypothetical protein [Nonomuraea sp. bgisy101]|uniref:hypothetical protein n=1 Tax=Nonomuraea sp. bgisy101 TaxID=3413784 RepID=UPI003D74A672
MTSPDDKPDLGSPEDEHGVGSPVDDGLEAELVALADFLDVPAAPPPADVAAAVRARLEQPAPESVPESVPAPATPPAPGEGGGSRGDHRPARRRRWGRSRWGLVAAVVVAVVALTAATPQGRATVVHILRLAGIELRVGENGTPPPSPVPLPGERDVTLDDARRLVTFPVKVPGELDAPDRVTVSDGARIVSMFWPDGVRIDQFEGLAPYFVKQLGEPWPDNVRVDGAEGWWIDREHALSRVDRKDGTELPLRLAGPTLVWFDGEVAIRLEGVKDKRRALEIAASLR